MAYTEIIDYFPSANKKNRIRYRICIPKDTPKGIIQISHGMCEYFDRYSDTIDHFIQKGFVVCGNDHMGHGESVQDETELGYFGKDCWHCFADDLNTLNGILRKRYRSLPYILLGHSMGSFAVRDYITRYADSVDGVIICGTSGTNKATGIGIALCTVLSKLRGDRYRSRFIRNLVFGSYNSRFKEENDHTSWLTRDESVRNEHRGDKRCRFIFTLDGFKNMFSLLRHISKQGWEEQVPLSLPIFIMSGEEDPVGNYGKGVREVYERLNECELNFLRMKLYPGARHELLNETNRAEVLSDIESFIDEVTEGVLEAKGYGR